MIRPLVVRGTTMVDVTIERVMMISERMEIPEICPNPGCGNVFSKPGNSALIIERLVPELRYAVIDAPPRSTVSGQVIGPRHLVDSEKTGAQPDGRYITGVACGACGVVLVKSKIVGVPEPERTPATTAFARSTLKTIEQARDEENRIEERIAPGFDIDEDESEAPGD